MTRRDIPNLISVLRLLLVAPVVMLILDGAYGWALVLFFFAGISDGIDGYLAKHFGWQSELGGLLDPLADKLLMVCSIAALALGGLVPLWLAGVIILRDLVIVSGATAYRQLIGRFSAAPTVISKINTAVQIVLVLAVLGARTLELGGDLQPLFLLALVMAVGSGADYVIQWSRRARREWRAQR